MPSVLDNEFKDSRSSPSPNITSRQFIFCLTLSKARSNMSNLFYFCNRPIAIMSLGSLGLRVYSLSGSGMSSTAIYRLDTVTTISFI